MSETSDRLLRGYQAQEKRFLERRFPLRFASENPTLRELYRQAKRLIPTMDALDAAERDALCDAWTIPLREDGVEVTGVRIYRTVASVRPDVPAPERTLQYECGGGPR